MPYKVKRDYPANIYLIKFNNRNTRKKCEICPKLAMKTSEQSHVNDVDLVLLLLTLNIFHTFSSFSIVDFAQVNISWELFVSIQRRT